MSRGPRPARRRPGPLPQPRPPRLLWAWVQPALAQQVSTIPSARSAWLQRPQACCPSWPSVWRTLPRASHPGLLQAWPPRELALFRQMRALLRVWLSPVQALVQRERISLQDWPSALQLRASLQDWPSALQLRASLQDWPSALQLRALLREPRAWPVPWLRRAWGLRGRAPLAWLRLQRLQAASRPWAARPWHPALSRRLAPGLPAWPRAWHLTVTARRAWWRSWCRHRPSPGLARRLRIPALRGREPPEPVWVAVWREPVRSRQQSVRSSRLQHRRTSPGWPARAWRMHPGNHRGRFRERHRIRPAPEVLPRPASLHPWPVPGQPIRPGGRAAGKHGSGTLG